MKVELRSLCGTTPQFIIAPTYDDSRAKIALWNDPQFIIAPTYDDSRAKIALWNDPQFIIAPTYDDSRAKIALWNDRCRKPADLWHAFCSHCVLLPFGLTVDNKSYLQIIPLHWG